MIVSKEMFHEKASHLNCHTAFHPWNENCVCANFEMFCSGIIGTNKFYNLYYLVDLFLKRKKLSKSYIKYLLKGVVQSTLFGVLMGNIFVMCNCIVLNLLGKWHYYTCLFTGTIGGLSIFLENPKRRGVAIATFINLVLELTVSQLRQSRILTKSKNIEVFSFMISSAIFMYCLRTDPTIKQNGGPYVWFYTPPPFPFTRKESETLNNECGNLSGKVCPHEGSCWRDIMNTGLRFFGVGTCFQIIRIFFKHGSKMFKSPSFAGKAIFKLRNISIGLFLASYLVTYKAVSCALCHYKGFDSPLHALPAGLLAGCAYVFQPNISILLTVVSNLLMIGGRHFRNTHNLPDWPYGELVLAVSNGLLFHYRIVNPECCPVFLINMIDTCSYGKSDELYKGFRNAVFK